MPCCRGAHMALTPLRVLVVGVQLIQRQPDDALDLCGIVRALVQVLFRRHRRDSQHGAAHATAQQRLHLPQRAQLPGNFLQPGKRPRGSDPSLVFPGGLITRLLRLQFGVHPWGSPHLVMLLPLNKF